MGIGIDRIGHVVVDHVRDLGHVDAARGDVGGHQDIVLAVAKAIDRGLAPVLGHVALQGRDAIAVLVQILGQETGAALGAREDQHAAGGRVLQHGEAAASS